MLTDLDTPDRLSYFNQFVLYVGLLMLGKSVFILLQSSFLLRAKDRLEFKIQSVMFNKILQVLEKSEKNQILYERIDLYMQLTLGRGSKNYEK